jgi:hypothetical protein
MSIGDDVILWSDVMHFWPSQLNCPYCDAQSYPNAVTHIVGTKVVRKFSCPAAHFFYAEQEAE